MAIHFRCNINPNEHLVIFCSGRDEINGGNIHTSFKLHQTKGNEWIILTEPDGITVIDSVFIKPCLTNSSRGKLNYTDDSKGVFTTPSPELPILEDILITHQHHHLLLLLVFITILSM